MRFCISCNNMLYPVEEKDTKRLKYKCNYCNHFEVVEENNENQNVVYVNEVQLSHIKKSINPCIINDPTYSRTKVVTCPECSNNEAIYFHDFGQESSVMLLIFVCCNQDCGYSWVKNN